MQTFDPTGYSLRWYDLLLTQPNVPTDVPRDAAW